MQRLGTMFGAEALEGGAVDPSCGATQTAQVMVSTATAPGSRCCLYQKRRLAAMGQQASSRFKGEMTGGDCASALHRSQSQKWVGGGDAWAWAWAAWAWAWAWLVTY